jgi:2-polyprenyl-6-methoxyphenol hydroxylase-like FAD-dependent oxidoreductase
MGETQRYDAIVVGSGQAGTPLAKALARAGRKTAILRDAIFSHPTLAEALNNLFDQ